MQGFNRITQEIDTEFASLLRSRPMLASYRRDYRYRYPGATINC